MTLYNEEDLDNINKELIANILSYDAETYNSGTPLSLGILNGAFMFFSDMMKLSSQAGFKTYVDFMKVSSYKGRVRGELDYNLDEVTLLHNRIPKIVNRIYVYDDILDSGNTAYWAYKMLEDLNIDLHFVTLVAKERDYDFLGNTYKQFFNGRVISNNHWIYGYGLDNDGLDRNLGVIKIK